MSYKLTITQKPTYLHAIVTGQNTRKDVAGYLEEILRECTDRGCPRVLIEKRLEGPRLGTLDVFKIASGGSGRARGCFEAIAYVDESDKDGLVKFAENVAVNRAIPVMVFSTVSDAEKWLQEKDRGGTQQYAPADTIKSPH